MPPMVTHHVTQHLPVNNNDYEDSREDSMLMPLMPPINGLLVAHALMYE